LLKLTVISLVFVVIVVRLNAVPGPGLLVWSTEYWLIVGSIALLIDAVLKIGIRVQGVEQANKQLNFRFTT
jgi:hypothetical protein